MLSKRPKSASSFLWSRGKVAKCCSEVVNVSASERILLSADTAKNIGYYTIYRWK